MSLNSEIGRIFLSLDMISQTSRILCQEAFTGPIKLDFAMERLIHLA